MGQSLTLGRDVVSLWMASVPRLRIRRGADTRRQSVRCLRRCIDRAGGESWPIRVGGVKKRPAGTTQSSPAAHADWPDVRSVPQMRAARARIEDRAVPRFLSDLHRRDCKLRIAKCKLSICNDHFAICNLRGRKRENYLHRACRGDAALQKLQAIGREVTGRPPAKSPAEAARSMLGIPPPPRVVGAEAPPARTVGHACFPPA